MHKFDKGCGFAIVTNDTAKEKIEEQLGKATKAKIDPTSRLTNKIQKKLCKLRKESKFTNKTYFELYPSDPIPPRLYGTIKAHKPEKNFPMRLIVSTKDTPPYGISKYLVDVIQPTLNKNHHKVKNSRSFVSQAHTWKIEPDEIQVSYDVTNLLMVVLSESYLQYRVKNAIELALTFDIAPKTFRRYVDDSHARFGSRNNATEFLNVLNSLDPQIQYTIEYELIIRN